MAFFRDDRYVTDGLGRALSGAQVYYLTQPANTSVFPPTPLALLFTSEAGTIPLTNPVITDGFGHSFAYMDNTVQYTVYIAHPLFGQYPIILPDQAIAGSTISVPGVLFSGSLLGTINGTNTVFTLTNGGTPLSGAPHQADVWLNFPLIPGAGYVISGNQVTFANAPQPASGGNPADILYAQGIL
jgi:hypothetical protein